MKNVDFKKIILIVLGLVILFVPTYIAIASYYQNRPDVLVDTSTILTISDPSGKITEVSSKEGEDPHGYISLFKRITESGTAVSGLPANKVGGAFMLSTFKTGEESTSYKLYFDTDSSECYFVNSDGGVFQIEASLASEFLSSSLSIYLYASATPPVLTTADNITIHPETLEWYYLAASSTYQKYDEISGTNETLDYDVGNYFNFLFNIEPSSCTLKIYKDETLLYDGAYNTIASLDIDRNATLKFVLTAKWTQTDGCEYYGDAVYSFMANVGAPAEFKLGESNIEQGDIVAITGINVKDPSAVEVIIEPAINFTPEFFADGELVHALIPFSTNAEERDYQITVRYGISEAKLSLTVEHPRYDFGKERDYKASAQLIEAHFSESDIADYNALIKNVCSSSESSRFFSEKFLNYEDDGVIKKGGTDITLGFTRIAKLTDGRSFVHDGVDFGIESGYEVPAVAAGKVAAAGNCDVLGNYVVIDHGYGLKSWYGHLSEISVSQGDVVTSAQTLGKTGQTGFTIPNRLHLGFTLGDVHVAPFSLWDEGVILSSFDN